jgi:hypothetical protein
MRFAQRAESHGRAGNRTRVGPDDRETLGLRFHKLKRGASRIARTPHPSYAGRIRRACHAHRRTGPSSRITAGRLRLDGDAYDWYSCACLSSRGLRRNPGDTGKDFPAHTPGLPIGGRDRDRLDATSWLRDRVFRRRTSEEHGTIPGTMPPCRGSFRKRAASVWSTRTERRLLAGRGLERPVNRRGSSRRCAAGLADGFHPGPIGNLALASRIANGATRFFANFRGWMSVERGSREEKISVPRWRTDHEP